MDIEWVMDAEIFAITVKCKTLRMHFLNDLTRLDKIMQIHVFLKKLHFRARMVFGRICTVWENDQQVNGLTFFIRCRSSPVQCVPSQFQYHICCAPNIRLRDVANFCQISILFNHKCSSKSRNHCRTVSPSYSMFL